MAQVERIKHMKGGAMNREGGLPKTEEELKNYYCPECGEDSEIVFEATPFISEITPYVCVSCGKSVVPVDRRTDKQIEVWKYWQHGEEQEGGTEKDLFVKVDKEGAVEDAGKDLYCPECGENPDNPEQIVYEPNPHYHSPYVCTDCGKSVIPVSKDTGKQISLEDWKKERELLKGGSMGKDIITGGIDKIKKIMADEEEPEEKKEEKEEGGEEAGEGGGEIVLETEEDVAELYEEARERAIELLDAIVEAQIEEEGNPPKWVKNPAIWEKAKEAVEPYKAKQENYYATVAYVYEQMGGAIK